MRAVNSIVIISLLVFVGGLQAQQSLPIQSGQRVRVTAPDCDLRKQTANLDGWRGDTLELGMGNCSLASVARLEVSRGRSRHTGIGLVVGWFAGAVIGYSAAEECPADAHPRWMACMGHIGPKGAALLGSVVGAVVGLGVGAMVTTERWEEVPLDGLRVGFAQQRDGRFAAGLTYRF